MENEINVIIRWILEQILLPVFISSVIIIFLQDKLRGLKEKIKPKPYVAVLISEKDNPNFDVPKDFRYGFKLADEYKKYFEDKRNTRIQIDYSHDDDLDENKTNTVIRKLIDDTKCIMIIGNVTSTLTMKNVEEIIASKKKIPLIMPIATDNYILEKARKNGMNGILRVLPDNSKQTAKIMSFITQVIKPEKPIIVFSDDDNEIYSKNFSPLIIKELIKQNIPYIEIHIGRKNNLSLTNEAISKYKSASAIIYVGISTNAVFLINQLQLNDISVPLIMTDGCLVSEVYQLIKDKYKGKCYVSSSVKYDRDAKYTNIGIDTYKICKKILNECYGTRESVYKYIDEHKTEIEIENYKFNTEGNNSLGEYTIYPVIDGKLGDEITIKSSNSYSEMLNGNETTIE